MNNLSPYTLTKEQYQELYKEVLLFAQIGGVTNDEDVLWKMCEEEHKELMDAIREGNKTLIVDSVCDQFVTFVQLHNFYMSKPTWEQPIHPAFICNNMDVLDALVMKDETLILSLLQYWIHSARLQAEIWGFNLYKAIKEVNRSNMTKFPSILDLPNAVKNPNGTVDFDKTLQLVAAECESLSNGKYKDVVATASFHRVGENSDFRVVFRADNGQGKVCKYLEVYQEPNFDHCWL